MAERWFVVSSRQRFIDWCRNHNKSPRDKNVFHITREEQALGFRLTEEDHIVDLSYTGDRGLSWVVTQLWARMR